MPFVLNIVGSVFLLLAIGYFSVRAGLFPKEGVKGLIVFINSFAVPCLLFQAMLTVDLHSVFNPEYLLAFYIGAFTTFAVAVAIARLIFKRRPGESIIVGFSAYFTNTVLVGLPIIHRAYGEESLPLAYGIIGFHAPVLMTFGMLIMELFRHDGTSLLAAFKRAGIKIVSNPLLIGILLGLLTNLSGLDVPEIIDSVTETMAEGVLPVALFGLGGALNQYRLRDSWLQGLISSGLKLVLHPVLVLILALWVFHLPWEMTRIGVIMAAMPSGLNVYVFATYYNRATDIAANTILLSTVAAALTVSGWLLVIESLAP
ncbi:MAG: AEC family transporter [Gammaproteobacteria bacterium]|nr:AEC family transporter [Gammaproteobacteria bacterium]MCP5415619.1 AEC family transporter [Chromatiaceae bacterium]